MNHLIVSREYPPFPFLPGGIGTYVDHITRLLVEHGETVHVIGQRWPAAPRAHESRMDGRLIIHRVPLDEPLAHAAEDEPVLRSMRRSMSPASAFAWQVARLIDSLLHDVPIDVIEGQEYEAPLYYLLRNRALRAMSTQRIPVIVHLHSPTEFVFAHNDWDVKAPDCALTRALEEYTIHAADALLCPSRFLADIAEQHYQLPSQSIRVVPYPLGDTPMLQRDATTWRTGTICYVGRLELRKGVLEWVDAAVAVARRDPLPRFTFIGSDPVHRGTGTASLEDALRRRIAVDLQGRFTFIESIPRAQLLEHLRASRIAVVPSRWENFPNTCIEEMASGLPVLVSPNGGMREVVEDGRTGWIAEAQNSAGLAAALERALSTQPSNLAEMGAAAAASIRARCDNARTVQRQLDFRREVVTRGVTTSIADQTDNGTIRLRARLENIADRIGAMSTGNNGLMPAHTAHTLTPLEVLKANHRQQLALLRRAVAHPGYVAQWLAWHCRRAIQRLPRRLSSGSS